MAPRRLTAARSMKTVNGPNNYADIRLSDALCPICRCILIQPVTLPCNHDFCMPCFEGTLENANLTCPLCRIRFGSWHRLAKKDNRIVNSKLWDVLQGKFPNQVQNRLQGIEESLDEEIVPVQISTPGEIRKEYETQRRREEQELQKRKETEEKASAELIAKLKEQELHQQLEREEKLRLDEKVARQIAKEMGFVPEPSVSKPVEVLRRNNRTMDDFLRKVRVPSDKLLHDTFGKKSTYLSSAVLKEKNNKQKNLMNFTVEISDSNDSIENEYRYFKPIDYRSVPPSKCATILRIPAKVKKTNGVVIEAPSGISKFSHNCEISAFACFKILTSIHTITTPSRKRKHAEATCQSSSDSTRKKLDLDELIGDENVEASPTKKRSFNKNSANHKTKPLPLPRKNGGFERVESPFFGFAECEEHSFNGYKTEKSEQTKESKEQQEKSDLELARKLQEIFNNERYSTRSSITCRDNVKKTKQVTLTQMMSTSKCN